MCPACPLLLEEAAQHPSSRVGVHGGRVSGFVKIRERISEDEMIAVFVGSELESDRWREKLQELGDLDPRALLEGHRAYESRQGLFLGFPYDVEWFRATVTTHELLDVLYINWDWWLRISAGTRSAREAARRIRSGEVPGSTAEEHEPWAARPQPPLIIVTTPDWAKLVLLEGHVRLTAYALFPERVAEELEILLGISPQMPQWCQW